MRTRDHETEELSPVTRQHLELYQGGQLNPNMLEATKRRLSTLLERGEYARVEAGLRPGTQFVIQVRALAEIGTEDAGRILEQQIQRHLTDDEMDQAWYWIDLAASLRYLNREESLPLLLESVDSTAEFPLVHYFACETVCFPGYEYYARQLDTEAGDSAMRLLHRAVEGLRFGVPAQVIVEAGLGEVLERVWDSRPEEPHALVVRLFAEVLRMLRRVDHIEKSMSGDPLEQEALQWQLSRVHVLEPSIVDYIEESGPYLMRQLKTAHFERQADILHALDAIRYNTGRRLLRLLEIPEFGHPEIAVFVLRWSRSERVGPYLRKWVRQSVSLPKRGLKRKRAHEPRRPSVPETLPFDEILFTLRFHASPETEQFLLAVAEDWDPAYRRAALSSLGWWEPFERAEVLMHLQESRFDSNPDVRQAARGALARLGERQALDWYRKGLESENPQRVHEAIQAVAVEGLTLLWPDLDLIADSEDFDIAHCSREALEQMQEDIEYRRRADAY